MSDEENSAGRDLQSLARTWPELIDKIFGQPAQDLVGVAGGDYLKAIRPINRQRVADKVKERLRRRNIDEPKIISPRLLAPALEGLSDESDETLQDMWANLLANAMDPAKDTQMDRTLIDVLKRFEPIDVLTLRNVAHGGYRKKATALELSNLHERRVEPFAISLQRLSDKGGIGCVVYVGGNGFKTEYLVSPLGMELYLACKPDAADRA